MVAQVGVFDRKRRQLLTAQRRNQIVAQQARSSE
jgi:hypothetical protein